jgi:hypothetical protein
MRRSPGGNNLGNKRSAEKSKNIILLTFVNQENFVYKSP